MSGGSNVRFSIIVAVMVDMIDEQVVGRVENLAVHLDMLPLSITETNAPAGIKSIFTLNGVPFVFIEPLEIFRIDDGVFALCKWYAVKGVAVAYPAIQ
jgi:hypothetical protein